jgi:hypothetical protein
MNGSKPLRSPKRKKAASTVDFTKVIADAKAKVTKAKGEAFTARLEAIDAILQDAEPFDVMMLCARALALAIPICCDKHQDEFKADFLGALSDFIAMEQAEKDAAEAEESENAPPPVQH